jgi:hypothetical protein
MKPRVEHYHHRAKLPPILEIDEDDAGLYDIQALAHPRWSSDDDEPGVSVGEWPSEYDD